MNKSAREKEAVLNVFASLVRPLIRVAFEYGISASEISGVVRRTYIQALEAQAFRTEESDYRRSSCGRRGAWRSPTLPLCARRLAPARRTASERPSASDQVTNLLTVWHTHSGFSGPTGWRWSWILAYARFPAPELPRTGKCRLSWCRPGSAARRTRGIGIGRGHQTRSPFGVCREHTFLRAPTLSESSGWADSSRVVAANFVHNLLRVGPEPIYFERAVVVRRTAFGIGTRQVSCLGRRARPGATDRVGYVSNASCVSRKRIEPGKKVRCWHLFLRRPGPTCRHDSQRVAIQRRI